MFPFIKPGDHPELAVSKSNIEFIKYLTISIKGSTQMLPTASVSPDIIWLCEDEMIFNTAKEISHVPDITPIKTTPGGTYKYCVSA